MGREISMGLTGHPLEFNTAYQRSFHLYYTEPEQGVTENTGILLILHGYGTNSGVAYYKKLRNEWSTKYNVIAVGIDYLGTYGNESKIKWTKEIVDKLLSLLPPDAKTELKGREDVTVNEILKYFPNQNLSRYFIVPTVIEKTREEITEYNDFGYIQAMDCLYGINKVLKIYENKGLFLNKKRILAYGTSFGGYLAQMCAKFAPNTFSLIVDNSGYGFAPKSEVVPVTGIYRRSMYPNGAVILMEPSFYYDDDPKSPYYFSPDMYQIRSLMDETHCKIFQKDFNGKIIMFHSKNDEVIPYKDKAPVHDTYERHNINHDFYSFDASDIDEDVIKSDKHAMGADVKKLFERYCDQYADENVQDWIQKDNTTDFDLKTVLRYPCRNSTYILDYTGDYPTITQQKIGKSKKKKKAKR